MFKKLSNIGDSGIVCDFGDEVSKKMNAEVIKLFHYVRQQTFEKKLIPIFYMSNCDLRKSKTFFPNLVKQFHL